MSEPDADTEAEAGPESPAPAAPRVAPKLDPESLAIRARPGGAIRFKRQAIIAIAAVAAVAVTTIAWFALESRILQRAAPDPELSEPNAKAANEALASLPATYGDAPKLGPPLPGDLGRPILRAQREMATQNADPALQQPSTTPAMQNHGDELKAARESALLVQLSARPAHATQGEEGGGSATSPPTELGTSPPANVGQPDDPARQQRKASFVAALDPIGDSNPHALTRPASPYVLMAGSVIAASLITGLNSDLPGMVTAQVTQNVFDSISGSHLLIPQGSRLIGAYDSVVAFGQKRALVVWQRIILPDGRSMRIDNMPATDPAGYAGLTDKVDFHTWTLLKGIALATLLGVGSEVSINGESDLVEALRQSTQQNVSRAGDQLTSRNLNVQPTITIRPGAPVRLVVHKDLILAPSSI